MLLQKLGDLLKLLVRCCVFLSQPVSLLNELVFTPEKRRESIGEDAANSEATNSVHVCFVDDGLVTEAFVAAIDPVLSRRLLEDLGLPQLDLVHLFIEAAFDYGRIEELAGSLGWWFGVLPAPVADRPWSCALVAPRLPIIN